MKRCLLISLVIIGWMTSLSGQKNVHKLFDEYKAERSSVVFSLPGWLIRWGINRIDNEYDQGQQIVEDLRTLVDGIKKVRVLILPKKNSSSYNKVGDYLGRIKSDDHFEEYAKIRDKDANVNVLIREKKERIRNLLMVVDEEEFLVLVHLKLNLDFNDLKRANLSFNQNKKNIGE